MATGTSGGLLEDEDAQSLFKHELLGHYLEPFISMPGSKSPGKRVVVLDGFAGRGRYPDGRPASGERILQAMKSLSRIRQIEAFFVEKKISDFELLAGVVAEYLAEGVNGIALPGRVEDHLDRIIDRAVGVPLFLFLDPCGAGVDFDRLVQVLTGPRRKTWPPTEVLLNFNADMSRRVSGALFADGSTEQRAMDSYCGGRWWRQTALEARRTAPPQRGGKRNYEPVAHAIAEQYAHRMAAATNMFEVRVPVYRRLGQQPIYHLVFFTRRSHGLWLFAEAAANARRVWLRHLGELDDARKPPPDQQVPAFTLSGLKETRIKEEGQEAAAIIAGNLRHLLQRLPGFRLLDQAAEVFGDAYGVATDDIVRAAAIGMQTAGELRIGSSNRPPPPQLRTREFYVLRPRTAAAR